MLISSVKSTCSSTLPLAPNLPCAVSMKIRFTRLPSSSKKQYKSSNCQLRVAKNLKKKGGTDTDMTQACYILMICFGNQVNAHTV